MHSNTPWLITALSLITAPALAGPAPTDLVNGPIKAAWSSKAGKAAGPTALEIVGDRAVALSWDGDLYAFDAATGKRKWRKKPRKRHDFERSQIAVAGDTVVWRTADDPQLLGLNPANGKQRWAIELESPSSSLMGCEGSRLVVATHRGPGPDGRPTLVARGIDPVDGTTRWQTPVPGELAGTGGGYVFAYTPSGVGRLNSGLTAVRCETGTATPLQFGSPQAYLTLLDADDGWVATAHGKDGGSYNEVCATEIGRQESRCFPASDGEAPVQIVSSGLIRAREDRLYFATHHLMARNLDPSKDGWLFAYDLKANEVVTRSAHSSGGGPLADAGPLILSGFGSTGADDFAFLLDPADLRRVGTVALPKAANVVAVDEGQGYVATYDGTVRAFPLPLPGPKPTPEAPVATRASASAGVAQIKDLGWAVERVVDAHPKTGKSSGMKTDGLARSLAWIGDTGRLAVGGNDDKVRVIDGATGKRLWLSRSTGKDITGLTGCADGSLAAVNYKGDVIRYTPKGKTKYAASQKVSTEAGEHIGGNKDCSLLITQDISAQPAGVKTDDLSVLLSVTERAVGRFDGRGLRLQANRLVMPRGGYLDILDASTPVSPLPQAKRMPSPLVAHEGDLVQVWMATDRWLLREYCGPKACTVVMTDIEDEATPERTVAFDIAGGVWVPSVPSELAVSPDGRWLLFARRGLEAELVDLKSGISQPLRHVARSTGRAIPATEAPIGAFAPDGRLAVGMYPAPWQVMILTPPAQDR